MSLSNQVYSNDKEKYFLQNGINLYTADQVVLGPNVVTDIFWTEQFVQTTGLIDIETDANNFVSLAKGIYTFNFTFQFQIVVADEDIEPEIIIYHANPIVGNTPVAIYTQRMVAQGDDPGVDRRFVPISVTIFMDINDFVYVTIQSTGGNTIPLLYSSCHILAQN